MPTMRTLEAHAQPGVFVYVERSKDIARLSAALVKAQGEMEEPRKNRKGQYGEYADLAALRKAARLPLANNGLSVTQTFHLADSDMVLNTTLMHQTGEWISSQVPIKASQNPQQTMAYATYMRRMAYSALLSLSSEDDDDGEGAADAAVAAANEDGLALVERARKSLRSAESAEAIEKVLKAVADYEARREMPPGSTNELRKVAEVRRAALSRRSEK
jgi:hypothetical protein